MGCSIWSLLVLELIFPGYLSGPYRSVCFGPSSDGKQLIGIFEVQSFADQVWFGVDYWQVTVVS